MNDRSPDAREAPATLFLARHGRTALNAAGLLRGRLDPPLDEVGLDEARRLAENLARVRVLSVVTSPLRRAVQTADAVARRIGVEPSVDVRLVDRDYGGCAGKTKQEVEALWGAVDRAPGVEPLHKVRARALEALLDIAARAAGSSAVVVSHDVVIRTALVSFDPGLGDPERLPQDTGCFNVVERRHGIWSVISVNERPPGDDL